MGPASMGAEIFTCCRTMEPTLAAVIFVAAILALVRVLLPPKVGQSAAAPVTEVVDTVAQPHVAATAQVRSVLWISRMPYPPNRCAIFYRACHLLVRNKYINGELTWILPTLTLCCGP